MLHNYMSLEIQIKDVLNNFEHASSEEILEILNQVKPCFKSKTVSNYLQTKIQKIQDADRNKEKKQSADTISGLVSARSVNY